MGLWTFNFDITALVHMRLRKKKSQYLSVWLSLENTKGWHLMPTCPRLAVAGQQLPHQAGHSCLSATVPVPHGFPMSRNKFSCNQSCHCLMSFLTPGLLPAWPQRLKFANWISIQWLSLNMRLKSFRTLRIRTRQFCWNLRKTNLECVSNFGSGNLIYYLEFYEVNGDDPSKTVVNTDILKNGIQWLHVRSRKVYNPSKKMEREIPDWAHPRATWKEDSPDPLWEVKMWLALLKEALGHG